MRNKVKRQEIRTNTEINKMKLKVQTTKNHDKYNI